MSSDCKLCKKEITGNCLGCSLGIICAKCSKNINLAKYQPSYSLDTVLWCLAETYFRKGKGEEITFEEIWNEGNNLELVKFEDLIKGFLKNEI